jgi:hypothetical protein
MMVGRPNPVSDSTVVSTLDRLSDYAISMFSRWSGHIVPGKLYIGFLKSENNVVSIGQRAGGKSISTEKAVFRFQSIQVNNVSYLHGSSFQSRKCADDYP